MVKCSFCRKRFNCASELAHHLELGGCVERPSLERHVIFNVIRQVDRLGLITNRWFETVDRTDGKSQDKMYRCPQGPGCGKGFVCLGALIVHLESGSCSATTFEDVQGRANHLTREPRELMSPDTDRKASTPAPPLVPFDDWGYLSQHLGLA